MSGEPKAADAASARTDAPKMRVYCAEHSLLFTAPRAPRVACERDGQEMDRDFPRGEFWEHCCDCQSFVQTDYVKGAKAEASCPVCDREIARRYLCDGCRVISYESDGRVRGRQFTLGAQGSPQPSCPGCGRVPPRRLRRHSCEVIGADFATPHEKCPFCQDEIALPVSFPASVADYLRDFRGARVSVRHNAAEWLLVEDEAGDFFVVPLGNEAGESIVLPKATSFRSAEEYAGHCKDYYDCESPSAGEIVILSPAVVRKGEGGWKIAQVGRLEVRREGAAAGATTKELTPKSLPQAGPPPASSQQPVVCPVCQRPASPTHKFCKGCGGKLPTPTAALPAPPGGSNAARAETAPMSNTGQFSTSNFTDSLPTLDTSPLSSSQTDSSVGKTGGVSSKTIIGGLCALIALVVIVSLSLMGSGTIAVTTRGKLDGAIAKGNLFTPSGASAYDYYRQLKQEGASPNSLSDVDAKLLPMLTTRPQQLIDDLTNNFESVGGQLSDWQDAQKSLEWASQIRPNDSPLAAKAAYCKGRVALIQEQWDDAIEAWKQASKSDPAWALPVNGIGLAYNMKHDYPTARGYLREAMRLAPKWAAPYNNMGTSYFLENNYSEAEGYYEQANALAPQWCRPYAWLGDIAAKRNDYCRASQMYQQAISHAVSGMSNWNPQRIQQSADRAAARCNSTSENERRIGFGAGETTATVSGETAGVDAYTIKVLARQTMTLDLRSAENNATLHVIDARSEPLGGEGGTSWSGTMPETADYRILVKPTTGTARYTLSVSIPPPV